MIVIGGRRVGRTYLASLLNDAERHRHIRNTDNNGYNLNGSAGIGKWHVSRKMRDGIGEYFFGDRLDAMVDADRFAAAAHIPDKEE